MHEAARSVDGDALVRVHAVAAHPWRLRAALQSRRDAVIEVDGRQATVGCQVLARCGAQALGAGELGEDAVRHAGGMEGADRLQCVRALVGQVQTGAGVDETHLADGAVHDPLLQQRPAGLEVQLVVDGDLHRRRPARPVPHGGEVLAVDGQRFLHQQRRYSRLGGGFENFQANIRWRVHVHEIGLLPGHHLAVVGVPRRYAEFGTELGDFLRVARRHRHEAAPVDVCVGLGVTAGAATADADDGCPVVAHALQAHGSRTTLAQAPVACSSKAS